jgi:hypothetical protein
LLSAGWIRSPLRSVQALSRSSEAEPSPERVTAVFTRRNLLRSTALWAGAAVCAHLSANALLAFSAATSGAVLVLIIVVQVLSEDEVEERRLLKWSLSSFVLHLVIGGLLLTSRRTVDFLAKDALFYADHAKLLFEHGASGIPRTLALSSEKAGFSYMLAGLFWLFGPYPIVGVVANALFAAAMVPIMSDLTRRLFGAQASRRVPILAVGLPGFILWPSMLLRESGILVLLSAVANCSVRMTQRYHLVAAGLLALAFQLLLTFRGYVALAVLGGTLLGVALARRRRLVGLAAGLSLTAVLVILVVGTGVGLGAYRNTTKWDLNLAQLQVARTDMAETADSRFDPHARVSTLGEALVYLPRGLPQFLFGPFPWQIRARRQIPLLGDSVAWLAMAPFAVLGLQRGLRLQGRRLLPLLGPALAVTGILSLLSGNFGFVVRERPQVAVFLVPIVALGIDAALRRKPGPRASPA